MWSMFTLGLLGGLSATPHCLGMCGGFPLYLAKASRGNTLLRQLLFVAGKCFTYIFLGALAGTAGAILLKGTSATTLRIAGGVLTLIFGLTMIGIRLPQRTSQHKSPHPIAAFIRSTFGGLLVSPTPTSAFLLGMGVGYLPCPLPIGMLLIATASHNIFIGMAIMAGVGVGTAPGLLGLGLFGAGLFQGINRKFAVFGMKAAGVLVIGIALIAIGRATGIISTSSTVGRVVPSCCSESQHR